MATVEIPPQDQADNLDGRGSRSRPGRPGGPGPDGRRLIPAGKGFMVLVIALIFATFLNARGMHKTAAEQSPGAARDVALWLSARLVDVSSALDLDMPRSALKDVLGRDGDDKVNSQINFASPLAV